MPSPRSAYVHVPFCNHRCGYCDFTVVAGRLDLQSSYLQAIELELADLNGPQEVDTLFIGGGTPTEMTPDGLVTLLNLLRHWFPLASKGEFSVEANPDGLTPEKVDILSDHRVNRLSLGVQSFNNDKLKRLDRLHTVEQVTKAIDIVRPKISQLSVDLIFAAPEETA